MLRFPFAALHYVKPIIRPFLSTRVPIIQFGATFSKRTFSSIGQQSSIVAGLKPSISSNFPQNASILQSVVNTGIYGQLQLQQTRNVTKFSLKKGKRKTVKAALKRFMRLDWGGWIRTRSGRHKKMWRKSGDLKRRLRQHVLVNSTQSWLLDKMVTQYWRRPKYYIDDPYRPYHSREEFYATRKRPFKY